MRCHKDGKIFRKFTEHEKARQSTRTQSPRMAFGPDVVPTTGKNTYELLFPEHGR